MGREKFGEGHYHCGGVANATINEALKPFYSFFAASLAALRRSSLYQWIIGDDLKQPHQIVLEFYEGEAKEYDKKGLLKQSAAIDIIMPDRPFIAKTAFDFFKKMEKEAIENAARKEQEQASHTPHMVSARQLFTAVAKAILLDHRRKRDGEIEALAEQLRLHAEMKSDWPLEITFAKNPQKTMTEDFEIECPEFLLYHERTDGNWTLKKVNTLSAAQAEITKRGYNLKTTARMAVLHHLKPLGFSLFADTVEGLVRVKKQEASSIKKLNLSWKSSTK